MTELLSDVVMPICPEGFVEIQPMAGFAGQVVVNVEMGA